jgi:hypothetical protein
MLYSFAILSLSMMCLFVNSLAIKPKFCVNCKHFIPHEHNNEYGKCSLFIYENSKYLVDGIARENEYYTCSTARSSVNLCGKEGAKYRKKYTKKFVKEPLQK